MVVLSYLEWQKNKEFNSKMSHGIYTLERKYDFSASHQLGPELGEKETNIHGHNYVLEVRVRGPLNDKGVVMDLNDLDRVVQEEVIVLLDHRHLNDVLDFSPTMEMISEWIYDRIKGRIEILHEIGLQETSKNSVVFRKGV